MNETTLRETAENLGELIPILGKNILKPIETKAKNVLSPVQINLLNVLKDGKTYSMGELAEIMKVSNPQVTSVLNPLVDKKYVKRVNAANDRRVVNATITDLGLKKINEFQEGMVDLLISKLADLDEEDCLKLNESISGIKEIFEKLYIR